MRRAYVRHGTIFREAVARQRGVLYKTIGDAFLVALPTAPATVAPLEAQLALTAEPWDGMGRLMVRRR